MQRQIAGLEDSGEAMSVRQLILVLWEGRWLITLSTAFASVAALTYALLATPIYRSEALVKIREELPVTGALGAIAGQFGGLAGLAGVPNGSGERAVALATLQSRALIEPYIIEGQILQALYSDDWDKGSGRWIDDDVPSVWMAYNQFVTSVLKVSEDRKSGLVTIAVEWRDPVLARAWVTDLIARANDHLRRKAIREGEANLAYLEGQARSIRQVELQQALFGLMEAEQKKLMLARGGEEYAVQTIDAAVVPQKKVRPRRALICMAGFTAGGFFGVLFVLIRNLWRGQAP